MKPYIILLRGINVGGKNRLPMSELKECLQQLGYTDVLTYIASGNVILKSDKSPVRIKAEIEDELPRRFKLDSELIKVQLLSKEQLHAVIDNKPSGFGDQPDMYHSDVVFLMDIPLNDALAVFDPRDGVDKIWPGDSVIYSQRLSAERTRSRLSKIVGTPIYKSMTIRSWNTALRLYELVANLDNR